MGLAYIRLCNEYNISDREYTEIKILQQPVSKRKEVKWLVYKRQSRKEFVYETHNSQEEGRLSGAIL